LGAGHNRLAKRVDKPVEARYNAAIPVNSSSSRSRRRFVAEAALAGGAWALRGATARAQSDAVDHPLASFDREMETFMQARNVPGGALAVVKDRRLVFARGYGWADKEKQSPVTPKSLFRIASISKPVTGVAVMKLVEQRKLGLDDRAFDFIDLEPLLSDGRMPDARLKQITIRQCLQHTGGWDRDQSFDPMFRPVDFARSLGTPPPADARDVIRNMLGLPLDFDPGRRYAYSNFGYCVVGRVIEKVTGRSYEQFVKETILAPAGIKHMRIGASLDGQQAPGEVRYYMPEDEQADSVFAARPGKVSWPYGGFHLEAMDAHGGWIASAVHLARFAAALDEPARSPLLKPDSIAMMYEPPPAPVSRQEDGSLKDAYYGLGWNVRPITGRPGRANYWH
jgi:N-acyl-D-amino-acid deacylase